MSYIKINEIYIRDKVLRIKFHPSEEIAKYFKSPYIFECEYSYSLNGTPESIAIIPFICNILPIAWLTDTAISVNEIDTDFYANLDQIRAGYHDMYPQMDFRGHVDAKKFIGNTPISQNNVGMFFSGGVDAFATLIAHEEEKPTLITLWGSDISLKDINGWEIVKKHTLKVGDDFGLDSIFIKSNFRDFLNYKELDNLVRISNDGYWHGFQHGIGLIGHGAPLVWQKGFKVLYIASSFSQKTKGKITCASFPTIDNNVHIAGCQTVHDQFEYERQEKVDHICDFVKSAKLKVNLRVCWISNGGKNCCKCEKCLRTMFEIFATGENPENYGLAYSKASLKIAKYRILYGYNNINAPLWREIQLKINGNPDLSVPKEIEWIKSVDFTDTQKNSILYRLYKVFRYMKSFPSKVIFKVKHYKSSI